MKKEKPPYPSLKQIAAEHFLPTIIAVPLMFALAGGVVWGVSKLTKIPGASPDAGERSGALPPQPRAVQSASPDRKP